MIHTVAVAAPDHAQLVGHTRQMRQEIAHLQPALASLGERLHGSDQRIGRHLPPRLKRAHALRQRLARPADQLRLRIEQIHMARPAVHGEPDDSLCLRGKVRPPCRERSVLSRGSVQTPAAQQMRPGDPAQTRSRTAEETAAVNGRRAFAGPGGRGETTMTICSLCFLQGSLVVEQK